MKATFNARCDGCLVRGIHPALQPRCAKVIVFGGWQESVPRTMTLCPACRKLIKGLYQLHPQHK